MAFYSDPSFMIIIQILIAGIGVFVSYWVATKQGEMAATKYTLTEKKRQDHAKDIVQGTLYEFKSSIHYPATVMVLYESNGKFSKHQFDIQLEEPFTVDYALLLSHLKTGYPTIYQNLLKYQKNFNLLSNQILQYYLTLLEELKKSTSQLQFNYPRMIYAVSQMFKSSLTSNQTLKIAVTENAAIRLVSNLIETNSIQDAQQICTEVNKLIKKHFDEIQNFWKEAEILEEERSNIKIAFKRLEQDIRAGLPLKGHCSAGQKAGYE